MGIMCSIKCGARFGSVISQYVLSSLVFILFTFSIQAQENNPATSFGDDNITASNMRQYIVVLNQPEQNLGKTIASARNFLRARVIAEYKKKSGFNLIDEYRFAINGFSALMSEEVYHSLRVDSRINYIDTDDIVEELDFIKPASNANTATSTPVQNNKAVVVYLFGRGLDPSLSEFTSRIMSGINVSGEGGPSNWDACKDQIQESIGLQLAKATQHNAKQIRFYPVKVSKCDRSTRWSSFIAGVDWLLSQPQGMPGIVDIPFVIDQSVLANVTSVFDAIEKLNEHGLTVFDRSVTTNSVFTVTQEAERILREEQQPKTKLDSVLDKKIETLKGYPSVANTHEPQSDGEGSFFAKTLRFISDISEAIFTAILSILGINDAQAHHVSGGIDVTTIADQILQYTPMVVDCVPQVNTRWAIFHGCVDWHSSVHGNWALLWASRVTNDSSLRNGVFQRYTPLAVDTELNNIIQREFPYGFAWYLALAEEAERLGNTDLSPLTDELYRQQVEQLTERDTLAVLTGEPIYGATIGSYQSDTWGVYHAYRWAKFIGDTEVQQYFKERTYLHYENIDWSESNLRLDFQDPRFTAALMMVEMGITGAPWENLITEIEQISLSPRVGSTISHRDGINSSRAWGLWALYARTGDSVYREAYEQHLALNITRIPDWSSNYTDSHWLGQMAIYALQMPEIFPLGHLPPIVFAGEDKVITSPSTVLLADVIDESVSSFLDIAWSFVSGPGNVLFDDRSGITTVATFDTVGVYTLRLTVSNGEFSSSDEVNVNVLQQNHNIETNAITSITGGNTNSGNWVLGYRFEVSEPIILTELGILEASGNEVLDNPQSVPVIIWTDSGDLVAEVDISPSTTRNGDGYYFPIAPLNLEPGSYVIATLYVAGGEPYYRQGVVDMPSQLRFDQALYGFGSNVVFPTVSNNDRWDDGFFGPTFRFAGNESDNRFVAETVSVSQANALSWSSVSFPEAFSSNPIVVMGPVSFNGAHPTTIRVRNVTRTGFEFQLDEWDYLDGSHTRESISYVAALPGRQNVGGLTVDAQAINLDHNSRIIGFPDAFSSPPVLLTQLASYNGGQAAIIRTTNITNSSASIRIDEEEANDRTHTVEIANVIAIEEGSGSFQGRSIAVGQTGNRVNHQWRTFSFGQTINNPKFIATFQTARGGDPITLRYRSLNSTSVELIAHEEQSSDTEIAHVNERVGWLMVE